MTAIEVFCLLGAGLLLLQIVFSRADSDSKEALKKDEECECDKCGNPIPDTSCNKKEWPPPKDGKHYSKEEFFKYLEEDIEYEHTKFWSKANKEL
jgi:hypothetical protein